MGRGLAGDCQCALCTGSLKIVVIPSIRQGEDRLRFPGLQPCLVVVGSDALRVKVVDAGRKVVLVVWVNYRSRGDVVKDEDTMEEPIFRAQGYSTSSYRSYTSPLLLAHQSDVMRARCLSLGGTSLCITHSSNAFQVWTSSNLDSLHRATSSLEHAISFTLGQPHNDHLSSTGSTKPPRS